MERIYFFTIILPVYNAIKYIEKTLESIILQSCNNFELIIIDDRPMEVGKYVKDIRQNMIILYI